MSRKTKIKEILKGEELLRINSLHKPISKTSRNLVILFSTLIFIIGMAYGYWTSHGVRDLMLAWTAVLSILYGMVLLLLFYYGSVRGKPLIITERGMVAPVVAELWEDIESYSWEEFKGLFKIPGPTVFSFCEGVCLRITNKGILQRNFEHGHTIFGTYLIFFSPEQIANAENIFQQYGIKKKN